MTDEQLLQDVRETLVRMTDLCGEALAVADPLSTSDVLSELLRSLWELRWRLNVRSGAVMLAPVEGTESEVVR